MFYRYCLIIVFFAISAKADMPADSPVAVIMLKYPESQKAFKELNSIFFDVQILFLTSTEIKKRSGHNAGGIRQNPTTKNYEILIADEMSDEQKAQSITHELEHIRYNLVFDKYLDDNPKLNAMGSIIVKGFKGPNRKAFISQNRDLVNFITFGHFCSERKAYQLNINLVKQGLEYYPTEVIKNPGRYVAEHYITQTFGITMTDKEIASLEKRCFGAKSHLEFIKSIEPPTRAAASLRK